MLSITSLIAPPFQKVCGNCHVTDVTISPTSGVYCNVCCSKSMVQKLSLFCGSIATNDELVLLIIEGKWLVAIVHMLEFKFLDFCLLPNKFNSSLQFTFMVSFACWPHLPLLAFKKTSNNLLDKQKLVWKAKVLSLLQQLSLMIMSNGLWNTSLILLNQNQFINKNPLRHYVDSFYVTFL